METNRRGRRAVPVGFHVIEWVSLSVGVLSVSRLSSCLFGFLVASGLLFGGGALGQANGGVAVPPLFGGIQVNEADHRAWVEAVAGAGLDSVQATLYARQQGWDSAELYWDREAPAVRAEIRAAEGAGLRTMLVMRVALEHGLERNRHLWHGMIWPAEGRLEAWMERYREFVLHGARLAADEGVDLFVIGNELGSLTSTRPLSRMPDLYAYYLDADRVAPVREALVRCADRVRAAGRGEDLAHLDGGRYADLDAMLRAEETVRRRWVRTVLGRDGDLGALNRRRQRLDGYWRELVADVRRVYDGPVSYGANFDQFAEVGFWDALDALAVTGYFPIGRYGLAGAARAERLQRSWRTVAADLQAVAAGLPVLLLELGWTRKAGATVRPYSYERVEVLERPDGDVPSLECVHWASQPEEPEERVDAMAALAGVVAAGDFPSLRGFTLWKLTTRPEHRAIEPFAIVLPGTDGGNGGADSRLLGHAARAARIAREGAAVASFR